jgi:hypothetical protein
MRNNTVLLTAECVRLPYVDNDFVYYVLGHHDDYTLPDEVTLAQQVGDLVSTTRSPDSDLIEDACDLLKERGEIPSIRQVARLVPFGKTKVARLMGE